MQHAEDQDGVGPDAVIHLMLANRQTAPIIAEIELRCADPGTLDDAPERLLDRIQIADCPRQPPMLDTVIADIVKIGLSAAA